MSAFLWWTGALVATFGTGLAVATFPYLAIVALVAGFALIAQADAIS